MHRQLTEHANRLVGFFDVLGFSERLQRGDLRVLHDQYGTLIDRVSNEVFEQTVKTSGSSQRRSNFARSKFLFDSVLVVSHSVEDISNVDRFIMACCLLMEESAIAGFPLRGAIGNGDVLEDPNRGMFLSRVVPSLLAREQQQEWTGCSLERDCEQLVLPALYGADVARATGSRPLVVYPVPLKPKVNSCDELPRWCLNWTLLLGTHELSQLGCLLREPKRANTLKFAEHVRSLKESEQEFQDPHSAARTARLLVTRSGFRFRLFDEDGNRLRKDAGPIRWIATEARRVAEE